jgi:hypothetical protein
VQIGVLHPEALLYDKLLGIEKAATVSRLVLGAQKWAGLSPAH